MAPPVPLKYRAFLSYAHADLSWALKLHRLLEHYRIPKDMVGQQTRHGWIPASLRPIFRDREDFSGGHSLTEATIAALDQSEALVVICSTIAATRPAVNEEVRLFRSRHPDRPVVPVIVQGQYPENFPPALRTRVAPDGTITDEPVTILGPDLRDEADGLELGLAKIVAGLIGSLTDDLVRRAQRDARRRLRNWVVGLSIVVVLLTGLTINAERSRREVAEQRQIAERRAEEAERNMNFALSLVSPPKPDEVGQQVEREINAQMDIVHQNLHGGGTRSLAGSATASIERSPLPFEVYNVLRHAYVQQPGADLARPDVQLDVAKAFIRAADQRRVWQRMREALDYYRSARDMLEMLSSRSDQPGTSALLQKVGEAIREVEPKVPDLSADTP